MNRTIIAGLFFLLVCTVLPACSGLQIGGSGDSPSAVTMMRQAQVKESLDQLVAAYTAKNIGKFNALLSERYTGEAAILDTAIRRDFSAYHNQSISYTFNNITLEDKGKKAFAAITFTRDWTDIKTSKTKSETKDTSLVFVLVDGVYKLESQQGPQLFGLN